MSFKQYGGLSYTQTHRAINTAFLKCNQNALNDIDANNVTFDKSINDISPITFSYLQGPSSNIQNQIDDNATAISVNAGAITTNVDDISINAGAISDNAGAIDANVSGISINATAISVNAGAITTNVDDISINAGAISDNAGAIDANVSGISINATAISVNAGAITTNVDDISINAGAISDNAGAIDANAGAISENVAAISINTTSIDTINNSVALIDNNGQAINVLNFDVKQIKYTIQDMSYRTNTNTTLFSGNIQCTTIDTLSDHRIKTDVANLKLNSPNFDLLRPVSYYNTTTHKQDFGFIAHELQELYPFMVNGEKNGPEYQSVQYLSLIALLVAEVQTLKQNIIDIKSNMEK